MITKDGVQQIFKDLMSDYERWEKAVKELLAKPSPTDDDGDDMHNETLNLLDRSRLLARQGQMLAHEKYAKFVNNAQGQLLVATVEASTQYCTDIEEHVNKHRSLRKDPEDPDEAIIDNVAGDAWDAVTRGLEECMFGMSWRAWWDGDSLADPETVLCLDVYPTAMQEVGDDDKDTGHVVSAGFLLDIQPLLDDFDHVSSIHVQVQPGRPDSVSIHGTHTGREFIVEIYTSPPDGIKPSGHVYNDGSWSYEGQGADDAEED